jgi:lipoate-protein ligase A
MIGNVGDDATDGAAQMEGAMHGEYKTPGGKLAVVDFEVADERLRRVQVSGDFFLYPEESLDAITGALEGLPAETSEASMARAIDAAVPPGAEILGTSPEGIAIAVRRALASAPAGGRQS